MDEPERRERHAEAEPEVRRDLAQRAEHDLGARAVRAALAEVVLHQPHAVEAEGVGQRDLLERVPVRLLLGLALPVRVRLVRPGLGDVDLVEQVELHGLALLFAIANSRLRFRTRVSEGSLGGVKPKGAALPSRGSSSCTSAHLPGAGPG